MASSRSTFIIAKCIINILFPRAHISHIQYEICIFKRPEKQIALSQPDYRTEYAKVFCLFRSSSTTVFGAREDEAGTGQKIVDSRVVAVVWNGVHTHAYQRELASLLMARPIEVAVVHHMRCAWIMYLQKFKYEKFNNLCAMQTHEKNTFVCDMNNSRTTADSFFLFLTFQTPFLSCNLFWCAISIITAHHICIFIIHLRASLAQFDCGFSNSCAFIVICFGALCGTHSVAGIRSQRRWRPRWWWRQLHHQRCNRNLFCSVNNLKFLTNIMIKRRVHFSLSFAPASHFKRFVQNVHMSAAAQRQ